MGTKTLYQKRSAAIFQSLKAQRKIRNLDFLNFKAQRKMRNLDFLNFKAQHNFRNKLFTSFEAQRDSALAELRFRVELKRNLNSAIELSQHNTDIPFFFRY